MKQKKKSNDHRLKTKEYIVERMRTYEEVTRKSIWRDKHINMVLEKWWTTTTLWDDWGGLKSEVMSRA